MAMIRKTIAPGVEGYIDADTGETFYDAAGTQRIGDPNNAGAIQNQAGWGSGNVTRQPGTGGNPTIDFGAYNTATSYGNERAVYDEMVRRGFELGAPQIQDTTIDPTTGVARVTVGKAPKMAAASAADVKMATNQENQTRDVQYGNLRNLQDIASGKVSTVGNQIRQGSAETLRNLAAVANARRGSGRTSFKQLADATREQQGAVVSQGATQGIQERMAATGQLTGAAQGVRGQDIDVAGEHARLRQQTVLANQAAAQEAGRVNAGSQLAVTQQQGTIDAQRVGQDAAADNARKAQQATLDQQSEIARADAEARARAQGSQEVLAAAGAGTQIQQQVNKDRQEANIQDINQNLSERKLGTIERGQDQQFSAALINTAASGLSAAAQMYSDERVKKDIEKHDATDIASPDHPMWSVIGKYSYRYKDPGKPGTAKGEQVGTMAQDLLKTKEGKQFVTKDKAGKYMVDYPDMMPLVVAQVASLTQALDAIEKKRKGKKN